MIVVNFSPSRPTSVAFFCALSALRAIDWRRVLPFICCNMTFTAANRATGCLKGIATGDAIGKQTETLSRADVLRWYPHGVAGFEGTPGTVIPR